MLRVLVVYASRHGGTAGIAHRIAEVLGSEGADVVVSDAAERPLAGDFDAYVVGSGVYIGSWLKEGTDFLEQHQATLASKPVWLFSSGPVHDPSTTAETEDRLEQALGPEDGPGSGGRKKIAALSDAIHPRDHRIFLGAFDPSAPPKSMQERLVRMMPAAKSVLPAGDFREWDAIETWAREIAAQLAEVPISVSG